MVGEDKSQIANRANREQDYIRNEKIIVAVGVGVLILIVIIAVIVITNHLSNAISVIG